MHLHPRVQVITTHLWVGLLVALTDPVPGLRWQALGHVAELRTLGASLAGEPSDQMAARSAGAAWPVASYSAGASQLRVALRRRHLDGRVHLPDEGQCQYLAHAYRRGDQLVVFCLTMS